MNIKDKINIFTTSINKLLEKDTAILNKNIEVDVENQIANELNEYKKIEEFAYNKKIEKMEKDFNKQKYSLEMDSKKEILNEKKVLQKDLENETIKVLKDFIKTSQYESFLYRCIDEVLEKVKYSSESILSITENDNIIYGTNILNKYNLKLKIMEDKYIGGCILEDEKEGLYIDNTIRNSVNELIDNQ